MAGYSLSSSAEARFHPSKGEISRCVRMTAVQDECANPCPTSHDSLGNLAFTTVTISGR